MSEFVLVFGRRHDEPFHALWSASLNGGPRVTFPMICRRIGGIMFAILVIG
jgi:hypothetical protein